MMISTVAVIEVRIDAVSLGFTEADFQEIDAFVKDEKAIDKYG